MASRPNVVLSMLRVSVRSITMALKFNGKLKIRFNSVGIQRRTQGQAHFTDKLQDKGAVLLGELDSFPVLIKKVPAQH